MKTSSSRRRNRSRKCKHCKELYYPDPRNLRHQQYCSKPQCRKASKQAAQQRWLSSCKGAEYFSGHENVARVQLWRKAHPGYWKRQMSEDKDVLQDLLPSELPEKQSVTDDMAPVALQDVCSLQPALIIGLIASLTGSTLQDHIAETANRFIISGRDIIGCVPQPPRP